MFDHSLVSAVVLSTLWYKHSHEDNGDYQDNCTHCDQHRNYDTRQFAFLTLEHNSLWGCVCGGGEGEGYSVWVLRGRERERSVVCGGGGEGGGRGI